MARYRKTEAIPCVNSRCVNGKIGEVIACPFCNGEATTIEALQLRWDNWSEMCDFAGVGTLHDGNPEGWNVGGTRIMLHIPTAEGLMLAQEDDYIVKAADGSLTHCHPKQFEDKFRAE